ncbi:MAG TPA: hypothetical protein VKG44_01990, partial [Candidatus Baltobacteraceae bacterium]|nr:hypothetical protein [Candidatus Baltobacteraceae bacterium]
MKRKAAWGVAANSEPIWPATLATLVTMVINYYLPDRFTLGPPWLMPAMLAAILLPLNIFSPRRHPNESRWRQVIALFTIAIVTCFNLASLAVLLRTIVLDP